MVKCFPNTNYFDKLHFTNPATKAPDTAVRKTKALTPIVIPRNFLIDDKIVPENAGFCVGSKTSIEVHKSTE
jgi:hypothetical protein